MRVLENSAGDGDPLPLTGGQTNAFFADDGLVAVRAFVDERVGIGRTRCVFDFVQRRSLLCEADVFLNGAAE